MENDFVKPESRREFEGQLHFSYSQLNTYLICPAKYGHSYVWGTTWESKPIALPFGKAVHKAASLSGPCGWWGGGGGHGQGIGNKKGLVLLQALLFSLVELDGIEPTTS